MDSFNLLLDKSNILSMKYEELLWAISFAVGAAIAFSVVISIICPDSILFIIAANIAEYWLTDMESNTPVTFIELEILQEIEYEESMFTSCVICLDDFEESELCAVLPKCKHRAFHKSCLITWFEKGELNCPICRCEL
ncbi:hypothetical protein ACFE04_002605 [Oxalis oulophora]